MFKKGMLAGACALVTINACASEKIFDDEIPLLWQSIISLSGGPAWANPGQNQYLYPFIQPPSITYYQPNSGYGVLATGELFFGLQRFICPTLLGQLGLEIAGATDAKTSGIATVDGIPNIYGYSYKINHGRITLKGKLIANKLFNSSLQPYLSGGFGPSFNNAHDYHPVSSAPLVYPAPWFTSHSTVGFTYNLGLGLQTMLTRNWQVGVGYEFADWGKSFLNGDGTNSSYLTVYQGLALTHLYTNNLLFSVAYVF